MYKGITRSRKEENEMIHTFSFYVNGVNNQDLQQLFTLNNINLNQFTYIKAAVEKLNQRLKQN